MRKASRRDPRGAGPCLLEYMRLHGTRHVRFRPYQHGFSSARRPEAIRAVRTFGLLEYMRLRGTRRVRFRIPLKAGSRPQGAGRRRVLEYSSLPGTQRTRFRNSLLAALLYKIEELGLGMHPDLHVNVPNVGLRRVERNAEFVGDKGDRTALGEKEQDVRLTL